MTHIPARLRSTAGFTLVEVITVLVIIVIGVVLVAPSLSGLTARSGARGAIGQLTADIAYARILAVREGRSTSLSILSSTRYAIIVNQATPDTVKTVELADDYAGVALTYTQADVTFDSRGLLTTQGQTIRATVKGASDEVLVMSTGRTYRDY